MRKVIKFSTNSEQSKFQTFHKSCKVCKGKNLYSFSNHRIFPIEYLPTISILPSSISDRIMIFLPSMYHFKTFSKDGTKCPEIYRERHSCDLIIIRSRTYFGLHSVLHSIRIPGCVCSLPQTFSYTYNSVSQKSCLASFLNQRV